MFKKSYVVRFSDVDAAGILYYPRYLNFCHMAFEDLFNKLGPHDYSHLVKERSLGFPTVNIDAQFKSPLEFGDQVDIGLTTKKIGNSSVVTQYDFFNVNKNVLCFRADVTVVCIDLKIRTAVLVPDDLRALFKKIAKD